MFFFFFCFSKFLQIPYKVAKFLWIYIYLNHSNSAPVRCSVLIWMLVMQKARPPIHHGLLLISLNILAGPRDWQPVLPNFSVWQSEAVCPMSWGAERIHSTSGGGEEWERATSGWEADRIFFFPLLFVYFLEKTLEGVQNTQSTSNTQPGYVKFVQRVHEDNSITMMWTQNGPNRQKYKDCI